MKKLCVDRIVGDMVVCEGEDLSMVEIKKNEIPFDIHEGSIIVTDGRSYFTDETEEEERRRRVIELQNKLKNKQ